MWIPNKHYANALPTESSSNSISAISGGLLSSSSLVFMSRYYTCMVSTLKSFTHIIVNCSDMRHGPPKISVRCSSCSDLSPHNVLMSHTAVEVLIVKEFPYRYNICSRSPTMRKKPIHQKLQKSYGPVERALEYQSKGLGCKSHSS